MGTPILFPICCIKGGHLTTNFEASSNFWVHFLGGKQIFEIKHILKANNVKLAKLVKEFEVQLFRGSEFFEGQNF